MLILDHCSHALCEDCMDADTGPDGHFQCPICRKEQTVSRPATQQSWLRRLEVGNESSTPTPRDEDSPQIPHSALHLARRHFTASDSIRIANASSSSSTSAKGGRHVFASTRREKVSKTCAKHRNKSQSYYCLSCDALACSVCIQQDHKKHQADQLSKVAPELKDVISKVRKQVEGQLQPSLRRSVEKVEKHREDLAHKQQELELRVTAQVDMAKRFLDNLKIETLHNLEKMREKSDAKITKHLDAMEAQLNKVQKECKQMLNVERFSDIKVIASVRRLSKLFITDVNKELEAFLFYRQANDFNVLTGSDPKAEELPKGLQLALKKHVGTAEFGTHGKSTKGPGRFALRDNIQYPRNAMVVSSLKAIRNTLKS